MPTETEICNDRICLPDTCLQTKLNEVCQQEDIETPYARYDSIAGESLQWKCYEKLSEKIDLNCADDSGTINQKCYRGDQNEKVCTRMTLISSKIEEILESRECEPFAEDSCLQDILDSFCSSLTETNEIEDLTCKHATGEKMFARFSYGILGRSPRMRWRCFKSLSDENILASCIDNYGDLTNKNCVDPDLTDRRICGSTFVHRSLESLISKGCPGRVPDQNITTTTLTTILTSTTTPPTILITTNLPTTTQISTPTIMTASTTTHSTTTTKDLTMSTNNYASLTTPKTTTYFTTTSIQKSTIEVTMSTNAYAPLTTTTKTTTVSKETSTTDYYSKKPRPAKVMVEKTKSRKNSLCIFNILFINIFNQIMYTVVDFKTLRYNMLKLRSEIFLSLTLTLSAVRPYGFKIFVRNPLSGPAA